MSIDLTCLLLGGYRIDLPFTIKVIVLSPAIPLGIFSLLKPMGRGVVPSRGWGKTASKLVIWPPNVIRVVFVAADSLATRNL